MPAVVTCQGGAQPAALPVGPGPAAGQAQAARGHLARRGRSRRLEMVELDCCRRARASRPRCSATAPRPRRAGGRRAAASWGWSDERCLVFVERPAATSSPSRRSRSRAASRRRASHAVAIDDRDGYAPAAWAQALVERDRASAAPRARRRPRHRARQRGARARRRASSTCRWPPTARRSPRATRRRVTRVRWGGSLLEEARAARLAARC